MITGDKVYSKLKFENRCASCSTGSVTESAGRVHTSTATVGVMPEAEDVDVDIDPKDIRVDVYRSSGAGSQHVNKTSSSCSGQSTCQPGLLLQCKMNVHNSKTGLRQCGF